MERVKSMQNRAERALKNAVRDVVEKHKKSGRTLSVWANGKTVRISPNSIK